MEKKARINSIFLYVLAMGCCLTACKRQDADMAPPKQPTVEHYYPNSGGRGTMVTIEGEDLDAAEAAVTFAGVPAEVLAAKPNELVVRAPGDATSGDIVLTLGDQSFPIGPYTYQSLALRDVTPRNGTTGSHIRLVGSGFGSTEQPATVTINEKPATVVSANDTVVVAEVPDEAGSGAVTVQVDGMTSTGPSFTYQDIHHIKPLTGGKGTRVAISGVGFEIEARHNEVDFNGIEAQVIEAERGQLIVEAPQGVETGPLAVTINGQRIDGPVFTVVPPPAIHSVSPLSGPAGTEVTIKGLYFSSEADENQVVINGQTIVATEASQTELTWVIPEEIGRGELSLVVNDQVVQGPEMTEQNLGIVTVSPDNGLAGTEVTLTGIGFSEDPSQNRVTFNGEPAQVTAATATSLRVVAPPNLSTGQLRVAVAGLEAEAPAPFRRAGVVTLAGGPNSGDFEPRSGGKIAVDSKGNVYVAEFQYHRIKKITPSGQVSLYAGDANGVGGHIDGERLSARFNMAVGRIRLLIDRQDNLWIAEESNRALRVIRAGSDQVETMVGDLESYNVSLGADGTFYVLQEDGTVVQLTMSGSDVIPRLIRSDVENRYVQGLRFAVDHAQNIYLVTRDSYRYISRYSVSDYVRYWAGGGNSGYKDGIGEDALFGYAVGNIVLDRTGENVLVLDGNNDAVRRVNLVSREVTTVFKAAGRGFQDGALHEARFDGMQDIAVGTDGSVYIWDYNNSALRKVFLE